MHDRELAGSARVLRRESMMSAGTVSRRKALALLSGSVAASLSGCCSLRGFPKPQIPETDQEFAAGHTATFLAPRSINKQGVPTRDCIDAHAHFFNASDVTVKGYLEGPVAHSLGDVLGDLVRLLAPIADAFSEMAPSASAEFRQLEGMGARALTDAEGRKQAIDARHREREEISKEFDKLTRTGRGRAFRTAYERLMQPTVGISSKEHRQRIRRLDEESLFRAMEAAEAPVDKMTLAAAAASDQAPYAEGVLAFVGYMMSSRQSNLLTYQRAFTESADTAAADTIGVSRTLGSLVDFDRWLDCPPRSAHEDQLRLHLKLSQLSNYYMLPVISYNPWTDAVEGGRSLALVEQAIKAGCVAVKIYPPNGFRPWGNAEFPRKGGPESAALDAALKKFWIRCQELRVPVLAHAGPSMGGDDYHDTLSGPDEWQRLLDATFWSDGEGPRVSLGHFGGDGDGNDWTSRFAQVMAAPRGQGIYADLGYWEGLQCDIAGSKRCAVTKDRLAKVLDRPLGGSETVADRVMYGSDWLMLSQQKNWPAYAQQLHDALRAVSPGSIDKIFGENAKKCFGASLRLS